MVATHVCWSAGGALLLAGPRRLNKPPRSRVQVLLAKPLTFMNNSGESVGRLSRFYRVRPCRPSLPATLSGHSLLPQLSTLEESPDRARAWTMCRPTPPRLGQTTAASHWSEPPPTTAGAGRAAAAADTR